MTRRLAGALALAATAALPGRPIAAQRAPAGPLLVTSQTSGGQADDTATTQFDVDGLRVILRRNTANDVVAANLYLLGGTQQLTPATQGIESFLLDVSERGTTRYPGEETRRRLAQLGSTISIEPEADFTVFGLRAIRSTFDSSWAVLADRVIEPTLDPAQVDLVRTQLVNGLRQAESSPDEAVREIADSLLFANHPYGLDPQGTPESIAAITPAQLRAYHGAAMVKSRMLLVVVGNVERARLEGLVRSTLGTLPSGGYRWAPPRDVPPVTTAFALDRRALPTNYVLGYYIGPRAGTRDYTALRLATAVLSGRFFTEIRSKRNLSYAADAPFVERAIATGGLYVTTVDPDAALSIMYSEIQRLQTETIAPDALDRLVEQFITDYFLKNETNGDQATFLARAALYDGDYREADRFVQELHRITPEDIRHAAQRYMHNIRFAYVGDPSKVTPAVLQRF